ncbi:short-chain dehydrogenase [Macrophomina phaseolina]|uniref:Short-chain dehydrogenase n=1 Tax=Macrophomina phaseolina TaxID=35725 RepID=A0ABQ8GLN9_9PEZI|nr:short-chain dehydrogenase [Macrophomina phaseolina]
MASVFDILHDGINRVMQIKENDSPNLAWGAIPDLHGKVALVTGANSSQGIGYHVAQQLAIKGARVYIGARAHEKAEDAIRQMRKEATQISDSQLLPFVADFADLRSVHAAAKQLLRNESRLDILVNNAGLLARPLDFTPDGISLSFTVNHLAPFLLTTTLLPLILSSGAASSPTAARVITTSSSLHLMLPAGQRFRGADDFNQDFGAADHMLSNFARYGYAKLANILFAKRLHRVFSSAGANALSLAIHPGRVGTAGTVALIGEERARGALDPFDGAATTLFAAAMPVVERERGTYGGAYLVPFGEVGEASVDAEDQRLADELWEASEAVLERVLRGQAGGTL